MDGADQGGSGWRRLRVSAVLAAVALMAVAPYFHYLANVAFSEQIRKLPGIATTQMLRGEWIAIALVVITASVMGTFFAERYGLRGAGDRTSVAQSKWLILLAAPLLSVCSYWLFGRAIAERVPGYYPASLMWALAHVLKGALFDEVVARYGMMTICCGALASRGRDLRGSPYLTWKLWLANLIQAVFFTALALGGLSFYGLAPSLTPLLIASLSASLVIHLMLGYVYARYGLGAAMLCHFALGLKYILHVMVGG